MLQVVKKIKIAFLGNSITWFILSLNVMLPFFSIITVCIQKFMRQQYLRNVCISTRMGSRTGITQWILGWFAKTRMRIDVTLLCHTILRGATYNLKFKR